MFDWIRKRKPTKVQVAFRLYRLWLMGWDYEDLARKFKIKEDEIPEYLILHGEAVREQKGHEHYCAPEE